MSVSVGILDCNKYRRSCDDLRSQILQHNGAPENRCSELAPANHVPVAALLLYASHLLNDPKLADAAEVNAMWYRLTLVPFDNPPDQVIIEEEQNID